MSQKTTIKAIMAATQLSRATIDRVLNNRPGVKPGTVQRVNQALAQLASIASENVSAEVVPLQHRFALVVLASPEYNDALVQAAAALQPTFAGLGVTLDIVGCTDVSDEEMVALIEHQADHSDGLAVVAKNTPLINVATQRLMETGRHVISLVSDLEPASRSTFVGINNRSAGQSAGFIIGRHLQFSPQSSVAVVVGAISYRCHEEREIGFRSQLRHYLPNVKVHEVISGNDVAEKTYQATRQALADCDNLGAVYNVAGGNEGLIAALEELALQVKPLLLTHEINRVTEPLLHQGKIDYLISQDLSRLLTTAVGQLLDLRAGRSVPSHTFLPIETYTRFTLG